MFDVMDPYNYTILGMVAEAIEDEIDLLRKKSYAEPVSRAEVRDVLDKYGVSSISDLPTFIRWKVGDIEICD